MSTTEHIIDSETGGRHPHGAVGKLLVVTCVVWSLFQLWYASPLPFALGIGVFNDTEARSIHLAFAVFLAYTAFPAFKHSPRRQIPWPDWLFALAGTFAAAYLYLFYAQLAERSGDPTTFDIVVATGGLLLLLEATRRAIGAPLMIVAAVFLLYTFAGPNMPDVIAHKGAGLVKTMAHQWLGTEGVFGIALGVSTGFVFLFVLFGALLEKAGAGHWFIQLAFSLLGHLRGGPAKAAVVASGLSGVISGSSIANVVTTGTFTIPLMKRVGFPASKAGAVEVAASTNGQLTPPIMGAAAFLMVEFVGIPYLEVIRHAILPALISYVALIYIVHLEALKAGMTGLRRERRLSLTAKLAGTIGTFLALSLLALFMVYGMAWLKDLAGNAGLFALALLSYLGLLFWSAALPMPDEVDEAHLDSVPPILPTLRSGAYFLLPVLVLVWCLAVERLSPGLAAFWATAFMIVIVISHRPLRTLFGSVQRQHTLRQGMIDLWQGLESGARNMIGIGVATAAAGIVVGTVTLTGVGLVMTELVEVISAGNLLLMLLFTAMISLLLGLGLPTTANYIVVSSLMAPVIVALGADQGLVVPLIAVHLFVFYFGILADDTPPVGLAAFAAAAIARADPIRTGIQGFTYDIRTAVLPFMFIFNTELLLIGIHSWWQLLLTVGSATLAILVFAAATQGWMLVRNRWWETLLLLLVAFSLFRPGYWWDKLHAPYDSVPITSIAQLHDALAQRPRLILDASGTTLEGEPASKRVILVLDDALPIDKRLTATGLHISENTRGVFVDHTDFDSPAQHTGLDLDWRLNQLVTPTDRPSKRWVYVPALMLLLTVYLLQRRRQQTLT